MRASPQSRMPIAHVVPLQTGSFNSSYTRSLIVIDCLIRAVGVLRERLAAPNMAGLMTYRNIQVMLTNLIWLQRLSLTESFPDVYNHGSAYNGQSTQIPGGGNTWFCGIYMAKAEGKFNLLRLIVQYLASSLLFSHVALLHQSPCARPLLAVAYSLLPLGVRPLFNRQCHSS